MPRRKIYINGRFLTQNMTGVQRYASEVLKAFDELAVQPGALPEGVTLEVLMPDRPAVHDLGLKHIPVRRVGRLGGHLWEQLELPFHSRDGVLYCPGNIGPALSMILFRNTVVAVHSLVFKYYPETYKLWFRIVYNILTAIILARSPRVITASTPESEAIFRENASVKDRLAVIFNGGLPAQCPLPPESEQVPDEPPYALFVGSLNKVKNFRNVALAAKIFGPQGVRLKVAGGMNALFNDSDFSFTRDLPIDFIGQVDGTEALIKLYAKALCLVFPSFYEGSGLPPIEAMACGCPVVASTLPVLIERCGKAALYCDPHKPEEIAAQILKLHQDRALRQQVVIQGRTHAASYSWLECGRQTLEVCKQVL